VGPLVAFRRLEGHWLPWALIGALAAPPLAYAQWRGVEWLLQANGAADSGADLTAAQSIHEADRLARACALAVRDGQGGDSVRNPLIAASSSATAATPPQL
jgi:hypothetical protein